ncbi:hypothetical protein HNR23_003856 [Nocardiopsis mwathae]|uniref:Uncharacterized protein n=1 Tax=Nocardiopsis mwathae TaxID=1472723 RepID=A0A7X0D7J4_9ACTN|nr:hypothetical protein [Nocardiopsis mwathae]MBB6173796.1 hypothetical protein [Nocardiopsis mwathae]
MDEQWPRVPRYWDAPAGAGPWDRADRSGGHPGGGNGSGSGAWAPPAAPPAAPAPLPPSAAYPGYPAPPWPAAHPAHAHPRFEPPGVPAAPHCHGPAPCGPPARVGSAVAALVGAILTLVFPIFFLVVGEPLLFLLMNIPGIVLGILGLTKTADPAEVERSIGHTWACTLAYIALVVIIASWMFAPVGTV